MPCPVWLSLIIHAGSLAPDCGTATPVDPSKASTFHCIYICGNIEWKCRFTMIDQPTLYKDLLQCYETLKVGTILEFCDVATSETLTLDCSTPLFPLEL